MSNIQGCISISDKAQTSVNVAGVVSVVAGLALAILAQTAAQHFHTNSVYFFAPGVALGGVALLALVLVNCCRKEREESTQSEASNGAIVASQQRAEVKGGIHTSNGSQQQSSGEMGDHGDRSVGRSDLGRQTEYDLDEFIAPPDTSGNLGQSAGIAAAFKARNTSYLDQRAQEGAQLAAAIAASIKELAPSISPQEYRIQVGPYDGEKPTDMVAPPRDVRGVYEKIQGEGKQDPKQCAYFDEKYRYQVVQGMGDCFYIALISGFLHHMVAKNKHEDLKRTLALECQNFVFPDQHNRALALIDSIKDKDSLIDFLLDKKRFNELIQYFRTVAARIVGNSAIQSMKNYADDGEALQLSQLLGGGLCITPEHPDYSKLAGAQGIFHREPGNFLVICRPNHYDLLIPREILIALGLDTP